MDKYLMELEIHENTSPVTPTASRVSNKGRSSLVLVSQLIQSYSPLPGSFVHCYQVSPLHVLYFLNYRVELFLYISSLFQRHFFYFNHWISFQILHFWCDHFLCVVVDKYAMTQMKFNLHVVFAAFLW